MSVLCVNYYNKILFYKFFYRDPILNTLSGGTVEIKLDSIEVIKNGLLTRYDTSSKQVEYITNLCLGCYDSNLISIPCNDVFTTLDFIIIK